MTSRYITYIVAILLIMSSGCSKDNPLLEQQKWNITLDNSDKGPYGTYLAYQSLKYYFPHARVEVLPHRFRYTNMDDEMRYNSEGRNVIILEGLYFYLTEEEWYELKRFVKNGNEVVIFCSWLDKKIEDELYCYKEGSGEENNKYYTTKEDFDNKNILSLAGDTLKKYGYAGRSLKGYFGFVDDTITAATDSATAGSDTDAAQATASADTNTNVAQAEASSAIENVLYGPDTLGYAGKEPNFIRYSLGEGHITLHAAPLALSNYFLLQDGNENYLSAIWQSLPENVNRIYWNDFYMRDTTSSSMDILWRHPATRIALILAIIILLLYILFEGKRKQRIIPILPPLKNDSVSFVETVGRLYYNKGNHTNLADKMVQQFLEWVRSHYFLNTNQINESFIAQLAIKSGQPESKVRGLTDMIHELRLGGTVDDAYLYQLYTTIQQFYNNNRK